MNMVQIVTDQEFDGIVENTNLPLLVVFFAPWCAPCRALAPVIERVASDLDGTIRVVKLNVDDSPETAGKFGVQSIPNILLIKDKEVVVNHRGMLSAEDLAEMIDKNID